jgi:hypothetical protein
MTQDNGADSQTGVRKKPRRGAGYPKRTPFFFHRFVRLMIKTCAAMVIGADGCFLCTVVAATEDSARYRYAVRYFNSQLAQFCGWSVDKLDRVRSRCIDEGFLHYEPGGNRTPGLYWVLVDESLGDAPDLGPIGELDSDFKPQAAEHPADETATGPPEICGETPEKHAELTTLSLSNTSPPPPPVAMNVEPSKVERIGDAAPLEEMVEILGKAGLAAAVQTAPEVIARDYSVDQVKQLAEELKRRPNLGPGALVFRIRNVRPGEPVSDGWPEPPEKPKTVRTDEARQRSAQQLAEFDAHADKVAEETAKAERMEAEFANSIDTADVERLVELLPQVFQREKHAGTLRTSGWRELPGIVRRKLVTAFAENCGPNNTCHSSHEPSNVRRQSGRINSSSSGLA